MIRRSVLLTLVFLALTQASAIAADAGSPAPSVSADAVIVANGATGEVLYERNADARLAIASITKLMTALAVVENVEPNETVRVGRGAAGVGEASIFLEAGEELTARELLAATLIQSANDAAWALAAHAGDGSVRRFVAMMNKRAEELGLTDTMFARPDGLDTDGHYSSARDVLTLARNAMRKPLIRRLVRTKRAEITGGRTLETTNDLLRSFRGTIGVKTGQTDDAGWSQVAAARREGVTIYAVLLGGQTREQRNADLESLLDWGLEQYGRVGLVQSGRIYATVDVPFSDEPLELVTTEDAYRMTRLGTPLTETVVAPTVARLPVTEGQPLGEVCVDHGNQPLCRPLVAAADAPAPSLPQRLRWYAARALDHAGSMLGRLFGALF